ncbi:MAG: hypothetical protein FJZ38_25670, partial [Candidatus Rokubacteria bacterium]|nr:hypothetical protein [Candidatus Rokubacteria bacterium]
MSDPFIPLGRLLMLIFVPLMLLFPLAFAALVPNRAVDDSARIKSRGLLLTLAMSTAVLLAIWVGLVLTGLRFNFAMIIAGFWWPWFFPLWFFLAMPAIVAKNPYWGWTVGSGSASGGVRTASLVNRERTSPVTRAMWAVPITLFVLILAAIAARGLLPFGVGPYPGDSAVDPEAARVAYAEAERSRWILSLVVFGSVFAFLLAILPRSLRRTLSEPEPMDAAGSPELAELYAAQRRKRVLGLFWGSGVVLPLCIGSVSVLQAWFPQNGSAWGLIGSIGGSILGICGA